ncbi:MAG: S1C family serine protease [Saccharofermentanales bacterium]
MPDAHNKDIRTILIGITTGVLGTVITIGIFLFVFFPDMIAGSRYSNEPEATPEPTTVIVEIKGYEEVVIPIADKVRPSIVGIRVSNNLIGFDGENLTSEASGIIFSSDGYIITNQHVINEILDENGKIPAIATIEVFVEGVEKAYKAKLIGFDAVTDIALLKINAVNLKPVTFGDSDKLKVGELSVAIGSAGGIKYMGSVSQGIISGINREVEFDDGTVMQLLQTDAAVNPGNSGGALVNSKGEVIGINNAGLEKTVFEGINFAIPSNLVVSIVGSLKKSGYVTGRAWLGIFAASQSEFDSLRELYDFPDGILIRDVKPGGPAALSGIKKSDIITEIDKKTVVAASELRKILSEMKPGQTVSITIYRPLTEETLDIDVILKEYVP